MCILLRRPGALIRGIKQFDDVADLHVEPALANSGAELEHAADIRRRQDLRPGGGDIVHLGGKNLHGELILDDVVHARAATAVIRMWHLNEFGADCAQQLTRR